MAIIFIAVLFLIKNKSFFQNTAKYLGLNQQSGLVYNGNATVADLVNKDTDGDGIPDWEEVLLGTDPAKADTISGIPDSVTIEKLRQQNGASDTNINSQDTENLTATDKLARQLFATVSTLEENGAIDANGNMDQATQETLSKSLAESIKNDVQKKIYTLADIKIGSDESVKAIKKYSDALTTIYSKNPIKNTVPDVLQKFAPNDNTINSDALSGLDPIIKQLTVVQGEIVKTTVPQSLSALHLNLINGFEKILENLNDIKLYSTDPVTSLGGITKYETNSSALDSISQQLDNAITLELKK